MTTNPAAKPISPQDLASQLFDVVLALPEVKGDPHEAARQVCLFLREALVTAVLASTTDDAVRRERLKGIGESIVAFASPPAAPPPAGSPPPSPAKP